MKILFATNLSHIPQSSGGSQSSTHDLCIALINRGIHPAVLAALEGNKDIIWIKNRIKAKISKDFFPSDNVMGYPVYRGWHVVGGVDNVIKKNHPNVAIIQSNNPLSLASKFIKKKIKTVIYLRDVEFGAHQKNYQDYPSLKFIANSQFVADTFLKKFGLDAKVIHPLVEIERYKITPDRLKVVFINPVKIKGLELAFMLAEANKDIPFLFVESWSLSSDDKEKIMSRARQSGNIEFKDRQKDMRNIYKQAKLMLVPSLCYEAWGRVVTESQCSGIPALASSRGGLPESVGEGGVLLDPEGNSLDEWSEALRKLWFDNSSYQFFVERAINNSRRIEISQDFIINEFIKCIDF